MNAKLNKFFLVCLVTVGCALPGFADKPNNLVKMVTYFPVPYALYNNLYIKNKFDVGTAQNDSFTLELGSSASDVSLSADNVFLRQVSTGAPTLKMGDDLYTKIAQFGDITEADNTAAMVHAKDLTVKSGLGTSDAPVSNIKAQTFNTNTVNLFGKGALPACGGGGAKWQQLTIGGHKGYYLVCCEEADDCVDCYYENKDTFAAACEASVTGATWCSNQSDCSTCGCSCPEHSISKDSNTLCKCDETNGWIHPDDPEDKSCVPQCTVNSYKTEHKQDCCPDAGTDDTICYTGLEWREVGEPEIGNLNGTESCENDISKENCATAQETLVNGASCEDVENLGYTCNPGGSTAQGCCYKRTVMECKHWPKGWDPTL